MIDLDQYPPEIAPVIVAQSELLLSCCDLALRCCIKVLLLVEIVFRGAVKMFDLLDNVSLGDVMFLGPDCLLPMTLSRIGHIRVGAGGYLLPLEGRV